ncbi:hypothetical protein HB364_22570 [Pseudoflavitalea sp. X16]|uniref:hypothetical protein n=1 Tax=Paraflavitalea devenefica TaxID=2716334 RepID=UPI0014203AB4|nr:hypothetical protein [Paraflavitalea devenefica]NII27885.1 hypothetical protein [Paraflavitalea devenefica]
MKLIIDLNKIQGNAKKEWLICTLKLMSIDFHTSTKPQTLDEYNQDIEAGNIEIEKENFVTATNLKKEADKW